MAIIHTHKEVCAEKIGLPVKCRFRAMLRERKVIYALFERRELYYKTQLFNLVHSYISKQIESLEYLHANPVSYTFQF